MDMSLFENSCVADVGEAEGARIRRLLWVPPGREVVSSIDLSVPNSLPVWNSYQELLDGIEANELCLLDLDPTASRLKPDSKLSDAERVVRDHRWEVISPLVQDPERSILDAGERGPLVKRRSAETNVSATHIYTYLRLWWHLGQLPNALVPPYGRCGGLGKQRMPGTAKRGRPRFGVGTEVPVGINVDAAVAAKLQDGARFLKKDRSWQQAYDDTVSRHFSDQVIEDGLWTNKPWPEAELPSLEQFKYWVQKALRRGDIQRAVAGETGFGRKHRPRTGTARNLPSGPGAVFQIDSTVANIYLRSRLDPSRLIGRPVLYLVLDQYSRMIVGFAVGLSGPSWEVGKLALECAFTSKVEFCARYGVSIDQQQWPAQHLCSKLTGDRGWSELCKNAGAAGGLLNYTVVNLPPYRPDLKGLVESRFEFIDNEHIRWVPGASHGRERGDPKHKLDGVYTIDTFTEFMIRCILHYNANFAVQEPPSSFKSPDGRAPTPIELWNYGCRACSAPQIADPERVRRSLLHVGQAHESDHGLRFRGLNYLPEDPERYDWFVRVKGRKWREHEIRYDPRDAASIFLVLDGGTRFERCRLAEGSKDHAGWTFDEVADYFARKRVAKRLDEDRRLLVRAKHEAQVAALEQRARAEVAETPLVNPTAAGDKALRQRELREIRARDAWTKDPTTPEPAQGEVQPAADPAGEPAAPAPAPRSADVIKLRPSYMSILRAQRDAARINKPEQ